MCEKRQSLLQAGVQRAVAKMQAAALDRTYDQSKWLQHKYLA